MPLGLGLASSHAPSMFAAPELWPPIYETLTRGVPQPPAAAAETPEVIATYVQRIRKNLRTLREQLDAYQPDAIIIVGDDQREVFGPAFSPSIAIYLGESVEGSRSIGLAGQSYEENHVTLPCHAALARHLLNELVMRQFDLAYVEELRPLSRPAAGLGHAFLHLGGGLGLHELGVPVIPIWVNAYFPPCPTAARCYALGQALRAVCDARPERIAILGSGGLSHDPRGPRAGWIDEPLDHWLLDRLAAGEGEQLTHLFTFESQTLRSGTGEIRSWIVAAGAFAGARATVVDYLPAHHAVTGLGWAYWRIN
jgi:aromatic ring-opening dioxygenase catalytic subunit (LigB family)